MSGTRFAAFLTVMLSLWGLVHLYVFWRLNSVPWVASHISRRTLVISGVILWLSYVAARMVGSLNLEFIAYPLEYLASLWMGTAFLLFAALLVVDLVTLGGVVIPNKAPTIRGWAALLSMVLALIAWIQATRSPTVTREEVALVGLPSELNETRLVVVTDLHLGRLLGPAWLSKRVEQINQLNPDLVLAVGDVVDGKAQHIEPLIPLLAKTKSQYGVWAVAGNHEYYVGLDSSVRMMQDAGWTVLRDESVEVLPGLVLAGVDDLTARPPEPEVAAPLRRALNDRPEGAVVLLSHSPLLVKEASELGVGLMLCGHTHAGQIWPFNLFVKLRYPLVSGRHEVGGMEVIICRGTGTWGPRMRLWQPGEIVQVTLRSPAKAGR